GTGDMTMAVLGSHVDGAMSYTAFAINNKGKVRALAVAMDKRHPLLPDVPTFRELGVDWVDGASRGIGVPQVTATVDCAAARDAFFKKTKKYIPIITDGGMRAGGDICKAFACGSDAVMVGSAFARAVEAPGRGYHWGMATPHANLPRGTRIHVGTTGTLEEILFGPARFDDGSQNLMGALQTSMGSVGAKDIKEFQKTEIIIAPSIRTEGKIFQQVQRVGMGK
ncbi:MAG TPA: tripartite tricarboxylate transporter substrate-binding protein, partial [Candidatus Omnitrophota bacterium]|nr:tripartite tricarboxylate transporter substrate-binding protein [Candidatus Omnitrophota bacterium]